jgi:methyl-accepting chemotaxis protein
MRTALMVLGGALAGAGLGYLFSPAGSRARQAIRDCTTDCVRWTADCLSTTSHLVAEKAEEGRHAAQELLTQGQELAEQARETYHKVEELIEPVRDMAEQSKQVIDKAKTAYQSEPG